MTTHKDSGKIITSKKSKNDFVPISTSFHYIYELDIRPSRYKCHLLFLLSRLSIRIMAIVAPCLLDLSSIARYQ